MLGPEPGTDTNHATLRHMLDSRPPKDLSSVPSTCDIPLPDQREPSNSGECVFIRWLLYAQHRAKENKEDSLLKSSCSWEHRHMENNQDGMSEDG